MSTGYPSIDKPWLKYYSEEEINTEIPRMSAYDYLKSCNSDNMDGIAIRHDKEVLTYAQLMAEIDNAASSLTALGVKERETVVAVLPALPEEVILLYAIDKIGACISYLIPGTPTDVILATMADFKASKMFIFGPLFTGEQLLSLCETEVIQSVIHVGPVAEFASPQNGIKTQIISWDDFVTHKAPVKNTSVCDDSHAMFIAKTGGTTGKPKSVLLSDRGFNAIVHQYLHSPMNFHKGDRWLRLWPIFSATAAVSSNHLPLCAGMELILASAEQLGQIDAVILHNKPHHIPLAPMILDILMNSSLLKDKDLSFLRTLGCGGMPMTIEFEHKAYEFFKAHNIQTFLGCGYGMTENSSVATVRMNQDTAPLGGVGVPLAKTVISAFEPYSDSEKTYNEIGEICIQSPAFMLGYYNDDALTKSVIKTHSDGTTWLHSGDLGYLDENGQVYICDRLVRVIPVVTSDKVYPTALEDVIDGVPGIRKSSVVGMPDVEHPNCFIPVCFAILDGTVSEDIARNSILSACANSFASYAIPQRVFFLDEFPLTAVGKVDYHTLEAQAARMQGVN